jgi:hypothetical protein
MPTIPPRPFLVKDQGCRAERFPRLAEPDTVGEQHAILIIWGREAATSFIGEPLARPNRCFLLVSFTSLEEDVTHVDSEGSMLSNSDWIAGAR